MLIPGQPTPSQEYFGAYGTGSPDQPTAYAIVDNAIAAAIAELANK